MVDVQESIEESIHIPTTSQKDAAARNGGPERIEEAVKTAGMAEIEGPSLALPTARER